jgi:hypothetical protein
MTVLNYFRLSAKVELAVYPQFEMFKLNPVLRECSPVVLQSNYQTGHLIRRAVVACDAVQIA